ncbi:glutathione peroxidase [Aeromonas sp. RU39B]|uniref:glutathione peroxidase n=1 Tax=Aeromonas sp. RU39B TaxID=1907416 RepID=UPI000955A6A8|nr:glutathione peroxidase [Aeromonas sp. RU39B]SIQ75178.1 glutathione peroxidase [Aeromonas sp. RU39B]
MTRLTDFSLTALDGSDFASEQLSGKVVLLVNVASRCGFTPQYRDLEALYQRYRDQGLEIVGFPCNQFGNQEPGDAREIAEFCSLTYPVSFPLLAKGDVNGANAHPLYAWLKPLCPGLLGLESIKWNFTKFLFDRNGQPVSRHAPTTSPSALAGEIEALLAAGQVE